MNIVIYARFSSHNQNEQSIEGQLKVCYEYAERNGYTVIHEYIDRAISGTTDNRPQFLKMIEDSSRIQFQGVLVYQLDRFARNRFDSAIYKAKLKKHGVRVLSARENITDDASGILIEGVLESMAEYYSAELSQKIRRGMDISASKCLSTGGNIALGYYVDENKRLQVNPKTAPVVIKIFEMYSRGATMAEITRYLNDSNIKTSIGKSFNKNSLSRILKNRKYIGYYTYKDTEVKNGIPRIVSDELFDICQKIMDKNKKAPARAKAIVDYILTTKLFCGHCNSAMTGISGTGKLGKIYNYYRCVNSKLKKCVKKTVQKDFIEDLVVSETKKLLTKENIERIAIEVVKLCEKEIDNGTLKYFNRLLKENEKATENLLKALEQGEILDVITERIKQKKQEKKDIEKKIALENIKYPALTVEQVKFFMYRFKNGDINDIKYRKSLIDTFVNKIYLYDDKMTILYNVQDSHSECLFNTELVGLQGLEPRTNRL